MEEKNIITINQQKTVNITGVDSVDNFSDLQINLTVCGLKLQIIGTELKIVNFSKSSGSFTATGLINTVKYASHKEKLSKRLFK